jgi:hypothetical protein
LEINSTEPTMKLPKKLWLPCAIAVTGPMAPENGPLKPKQDFRAPGLRQCNIALRRNVSIPILRTTGVSWLRCRQGYSQVESL